LIDSFGHRGADVRGDIAVALASIEQHADLGISLGDAWMVVLAQRRPLEGPGPGSA